MAAATRRADEETRSHRAQAGDIKLSIAVCKATPVIVITKMYSRWDDRTGCREKAF